MDFGKRATASWTPDEETERRRETKGGVEEGREGPIYSFMTEVILNP